MHRCLRKACPEAITFMPLKKGNQPQSPSVEESVKQLMILDLVAHEAHIVDILRLNVLAQFCHHWKIDLPSKSQSASEDFCL